MLYWSKTCPISPVNRRRDTPWTTLQIDVSIAVGYLFGCNGRDAERNLINLQKRLKEYTIKAARRLRFNYGQALIFLDIEFLKNQRLEDIDHRKYTAVIVGVRPLEEYLLGYYRRAHMTVPSIRKIVREVTAMVHEELKYGVRPVDYEPWGMK